MKAFLVIFTDEAFKCLKNTLVRELNFIPEACQDTDYVKALMEFEYEDGSFEPGDQVTVEHINIQ